MTCCSHINRENVLIIILNNVIVCVIYKYFKQFNLILIIFALRTFYEIIALLFTDTILLDQNMTIFD